MNGDDTARVISLSLWIMLVVSALVARRMPWRQSIKMALAWVAIFGFLFVIAAFRDDFGVLWQRLKYAANPQDGIVKGTTLHIPMDSDGHFRVRAMLNGTPASFLIDSGATTTAISAITAERAGVDIDQSGFGVAIETANGTIVARRVRVNRLQVGPIRREDFPAITAPEFGDINVLGMNFLSSLSRWGVEGQTLLLSP
jgi:aspartyl protease family protein